MQISANRSVSIHYTLTRINGDIIDANHPMAGETLNFDVDIISVDES